MKRITYSLITLVGLAIWSIIGSAAHSQSGTQSSTQPGLRSFSPTGEAKQVQQVKVRFRTNMTTLGDPRQDDPFTADCSVSGKGRWVDTRNWVYEFPSRLSAGNTCIFRPISDLKDANGRTVTSNNSYSFTTGGPSVRYSRPYEGSRSIAEDQYFGLFLDGKADPASVEKHAWCSVTGLAEKVPVKIVKAPTGQSADLWLTCQNTLPAGTKVSLVWDKGIKSISGVPTSSRQLFKYSTRKQFFARFSCSRQNSKEPCSPLSDLSINFSAPISRKLAGKILLHDENGTARSADSIKKDKDETRDIQSVTFKGPFEETSAFNISLAENIVDDAGRTLSNQDKFPVHFKTGKYPPLAKFPGKFGILELKEGGILPVSIRGLENQVPGRTLGVSETGTLVATRNPAEILEWMQRVERVEYGDVLNTKGGWVDHGYDTHPSLFHKNDSTAPLQMPSSLGDKALEVIGIPLKKPGFYVVELKSGVLGKSLISEKTPYHVSTSALVTNMAVHFMWGADSSAVWVTALDSGTPVRGAEITIVNTCTKKEIWSGKSDKSGLAHIGHDIPQSEDWASCNSGPPPLMVTASKGNDFSFTLSKWNQGLQPWQFDITTGWEGERLIGHTVTDRSLFRAGETLSMKHFIRWQNGTGFELPEPAPGKAEIRLQHHGSGKDIKLKTKFDQNGTALSSWDIPKSAKLGGYSITIYVNDEQIEAGGFQVQEFKIPTMQAFLQAPNTTVAGEITASLGVQVRYLAGGGAAGETVRLISSMRNDWSGFSAFEGYSFGYQPLQEGVYKRGERIGQPSIRYEDDREIMLDNAGAASIQLANLPKVHTRMKISTELEFTDANGETLNKRASIRLWPAKLALGIKSEGWAASKKDLKFSVLALDTNSKPLVSQPIEVALFTNKTLSHRKRVVGGFYAYEHETHIEKLEMTCASKTDRHGVAHCKMAPGVSGEVILQAKAQDANGNETVTTKSVWLVGDDDWWFDEQKGDRMDLLVESAELEAGDTARIQVRSPFRSATALVALEREGVIETFVTTIAGREPIIRVPVKAEYAPNVYVSVLAVRGRVSGFRSWLADQAREHKLDFVSRDGGRATGLLDLSKPAFRLGMAKLKIGHKGFKLNVNVSTDKNSYAIRETASVTVGVTDSKGNLLPAGTEISLAVVDAGLLELSPNKSWNLLDAMLNERGLYVYTSTSQMQVVGKRHYGRKAVAPGGGGADEVVATGSMRNAAPSPGANAKPRELFETLLVWKGRVILDETGQARIDVPINDSLTAFEVVAISHNGLNKFGTGKARFTVTQDIQIISALPPVVRENDLFQATFSIRNTTDAPKMIEVNAANSTGRKLEPVQLDIPAAGILEARWETLVPYDMATIDWQVSARIIEENHVADAMNIQQTVIPAIPVEVMQSTIAQIKDREIWPVALPVDAIPGRGNISVRLQSKIGNGLDAVEGYMRRYPYSCFEQRTSKALALQDRQAWDIVMAGASSFLDNDGLLRYFATDRLQGSDILTAYVLKTAAASGWEIPGQYQERMMAGLRDFVQGRLQRGSPLSTSYVNYRKLSAIGALALHGEGDWQMVTSIELSPQLLPTASLLDWIDVVREIDGVPNRSAKLEEAKNLLNARLILHGTGLNIASNPRDRGFWWMMANEDTNAARTLLAMTDEGDWEEDAPRLTRGLLSRQNNGRWGTTTANAWGVLALTKFSQAFEYEPVAGTTTISLDGPGLDAETLRLDWSDKDDPNLAELALAKPGAKAELSVSHSGTGRPWAFTSVSAAVPLKEPLSSGYTISRSIEAVERKDQASWHVGDVMRIRLNVHALSDMTWVVIDDPVPAGATILGKGFANESSRLQEGERNSGYVWPVFTERKFEAYRSYYRYVPAGDFSIEYTVRLNTPGRYQLPPSRVEAMYAPEMFGAAPITELVIQP